MSSKSRVIYAIIWIIGLYILMVLASRFVNSHREQGCLYQRKQMQAKYATYEDYCIGCNLPACGLLGGYLSQQWDVGGGGYSWCTDKDGTMIYGTLTPSSSGQPAQCSMSPIQKFLYQLLNDF
ncbi:MAG: hypothetical protein A3E87_06030 [Gammaproteobacteria bacterium RIFCSPHIGHO2_12_FULL_35_23]|nr:MAG: hypothetical protein A3E87_06030 [Gammaproteobacteria bacterium RIFCSPHIGHO2_12_FULL_35_23]